MCLWTRSNEYLDSFEKLEELQLPPIGEFESSLGCGTVYEEEGESNGIEPKHISEKDYEHACNVFEKFKCKNFGEYTRLYCLTDALLLADVFEAYRERCMNTYGLDAAHYLTSPSMAQDAMLKVTGARIDLLTDHDM